MSGKTLHQILLESRLDTAEPLRGIVVAGEARPKLGQLLVERGIITPKELMILLELQTLIGAKAGTNGQLKGVALGEIRPKLGRLLVERGIVTTQELAIVLGLQLGIPCVNPSTCEIQSDALQLISESVARKYNVIPLALSNNALQVAMADVDDILSLKALAGQTNLKIEPTIAAPEEIQEAIERQYSGSSRGGKRLSITVPPSFTNKERRSAKTAAKATEETSGGNEEEVLEPPLVDQKTDVVTEPAVTSGSKPDVSHINLNTCHIQSEALQLIPESIARKYNVIPLAITDNTLQVAMADTGNVLTLEALTAWARVRIEPMVATPAEIQRAIDRNYKAYGEIEKQFSTIAAPVPSAEVGISSEAIAGAPVVRALDLIVDEAIKNRASDIHIEPEADRLRLRYRIDGVLHDVVSLPLSAHAPLISRLKILASMNIADHHRPQDGQFSVKARGREVDVRVATIATAYGEMGVLRILDKSFAALSLGELGFSPGNLERYQNMLKSPFGMILISGPTGSGKTTTLYASINGLDCKGRNIITIEDPVEYRFKGINQIQVNPRAGLTFATGLRAIMRLDPDVILVGEIRDPETAEIAVQAALTGHLVLASVHANDTVGSLFRLLDLGIPPFLVSSALIGGIAQRMVRRICPHCHCLSHAPVEAQLAYCKEMGEERTEFLYGSGCNSCAHTGYLGRVAVFEILPVSDEIRRQLLTGTSAAQIRTQAKQEGMVSMWHDGMQKVQSGNTTPCEVVRNVFSIG